MGAFEDLDLGARKEDVEIGADEADDNDWAENGGNPGGDIAGEGIEIEDFREGLSEEGGEEKCKDDSVDEAENTVETATSGAHIEEEREGKDEGEVDDFFDQPLIEVGEPIVNLGG